MTFNELKFRPHKIYCGIIAAHEFPNGYGISVVNTDFSSNDKDTYEVAITHNGHLTYNTPITKDVLGFQTSEDINKLLDTIEKWSPNQY